MTAPSIRIDFDVSWHALAACAGMDVDLFHPQLPHGASHEQRQEHARLVREAKAVCALCPVALDCLDVALANPLYPGIYGGTTQTERFGTRGVKRLLTFEDNRRTMEAALERQGRTGS